MKYLFIYHNGSNLGGVQTLISRIVETLIDLGHQADVVFFNDISDKVKKLFPNTCNCLSIAENKRESIFFPTNCGKWIFENCNDVDMCITFGKIAMSFVSSNLTSFNSTPSLVNYIVNDNEFASRRGSFFSKLYFEFPYNWYFKRLLADSNKFFMSEIVCRIHEENFCVNFPKSPIVPLPIDSNSSIVMASQKPFRIVSIGRIDVLMKTYNFTVPSLVRELCDEGYDVCWDIYGGGNACDIAKLNKVIKDYNIGMRIKWHGELPYEEMTQVLCGATVFLGMGTAALEAATRGVPAIVAIASISKPQCYGFLHKLPLGVCGESGAYWLEKIDIKKLIIEVYKMDSVQYEELIEQERKYALFYDKDRLVNQFVAYSHDARKNIASPFPVYWGMFLVLNRVMQKIVNLIKCFLSIK